METSKIPKTMELILASASPRRQEMLARLGIPFRVEVSRVEERLAPDVKPTDAAMGLAAKKAEEVYARLGGDIVVLAADTLVAHGAEVLGKPRNLADADRMLRLLSGVRHRVVTGVAVRGKELRTQFAVTTEVEFVELTDAQVRWYVGTGEPMDKAGAYAIQGLAEPFVREIKGSYSNVVGLPLARTLEVLERAGFAPWTTPAGVRA